MQPSHSYNDILAILKEILDFIFLVIWWYLAVPYGYEKKSLNCDCKKIPRLNSSTQVGERYSAQQLHKL